MSPPDWPSTRWKLTAPECYQLRYFGEGFAVTTFKLAVKELIAARALRIRPVKLDDRRWWGKEPAALTAGLNTGITADSPLAPVLGVFAGATKQTLQAADGSPAGTRSFEGVLIKDFVHTAHKEFGRFYGYRQEPVVAALAARGLLTTGRFSFDDMRRRMAWTDTGGEAADELDEWLRTGRARLGDEYLLPYAFRGR